MPINDPVIHVAMIILEYYPLVGGAQRQLQQLIPELQEAGVKVTVLTRGRRGLPNREIVDGAEVVRLKAWPPKPVASLQFTFLCLHWIGKNRPDIIHAYSFLSPLTVGVIAKRLWQIPLIVKVLRGGKLGDPQRLQRRRFARQRLQQYRQHTDLFIEISNEIHVELDGLNIPPASRRFLPNGVDTKRFAPVNDKKRLRIELGLPEGGPLVIYTGRLVAEKRLDQLVALWPSLPSKCHLILLGDGPELDSLEARAAKNVHFLGRKSDVLPYLQAADIFVLPSATEGLSNALLEAMSVGLPVVATEVGGALDVIEDGVSGLLVKPDMPNQLQEALSTLLENSDLRAQLGNKARATMIERYSLNQIASAYLEIYRSLTQNTPADSL